MPAATWSLERACSTPSASARINGCPCAAQVTTRVVNTIGAREKRGRGAPRRPRRETRLHGIWPGGGIPVSPRSASAGTRRGSRRGPEKEKGNARGTGEGEGQHQRKEGEETRGGHGQDQGRNTQKEGEGKGDGEKQGKRKGQGKEEKKKKREKRKKYHDPSRSHKVAKSNVTGDSHAGGFDRTANGGRWQPAVTREFSCARNMPPDQQIREMGPVCVHKGPPFIRPNPKGGLFWPGTSCWGAIARRWPAEFVAGHSRGLPSKFGFALGRTQRCNTLFSFDPIESDEGRLQQGSEVSRSIGNARTVASRGSQLTNGLPAGDRVRGSLRDNMKADRNSPTGL